MRRAHDARGVRGAAVTAVVLLALACLAFAASDVLARGRPARDLDQVSLGQLPREARDVYDRILSGGPFRYERDGVVFGNRERLLPMRARGYYHEYTVPTPGARDRGARRIICGGALTQPETCYYTDDHYRSFRRIRTS